LQAGVAESFGQEQARELNSLNQENYSLGRQNWLEATKGLQGAPSVFSAGEGLANTAINANQQSYKMAEDVNNQENAWKKALIGAGAAVAGGLVGGLPGGEMTTMLGNSIGGLGSSLGGGSGDQG
jgi:hypothetical protein